jgi:adenine-specific DNA-methyltransferase
MDKLKMQTPDLTDKNIERIASLFPNVITETKDENGNIKKAVDFDLLKQDLSKDIMEADDERYRLDWPGKKASLLKANMPITKTLRPCREESVNFDTTENLYIEGDNFEVLKILQESYLGKVKMIYIDPPYNTGDDFIYKDNFKQSREEYEEELGVEDEEGGKLFRNTDSNGRFHSDWLSMMHERLVVARDLLKDDGVIFISIDDNEIHNLRKVCDEVFGEENFVGEFVWIRKKKGAFLSKKIRKMTEYVLCYQKTTNDIIFIGEQAYSDKQQPIVKRTNSLKELVFPKNSIQTKIDDGFHEPIKSKEQTGVSFKNRFEVKNGLIVNELITEARYVWTQDFLNEEIKNGSQIFLSKQYGFNVLRYNQSEKTKTPSTMIDKNVEVGTNEDASSEIAKLFDTEVGEMFDYAKPTSLIKYLLKFLTNYNDIILDFFSGSATTAHAVMQLNAEDGGNRKFIMVQLPEKTDENSEAYKAGYKTIADIGKERICRAGKKIVEEFKSKTQQLKIGEDPVDASKLDFGFRVYKTDSTNMKDVFYHPSELKQEQLSFFESNIKEDRTPEDLLTQVILDLGLELSLPVETKTMLKNTVFIVQTNALVACFDNDIDFKIVDSIANLKPFKVVFKDASFKDDKDRINVEERFKRLSPETKVAVI